MSPPVKSNNMSDESGMPPNSLWVGNLSGDITDSDLMNLFSKYGAVDSITTFPSRSYAFVYFKRLEDAKAARDYLRGTVLRGNTLKIEFAKPAKPCKSLWVGGIGQSVTKEELEERFLKFGKIQDFRFLRDRNTAFVDYFRLEDATQALKNLNGMQIGGDQIRVDYLRSHPSRREQLPDLRDASGGQFLNSIGLPDSTWMPQDFLKSFAEPPHYGSQKPQLQHSQFSGDQKGDGQPTNVLWICFPPSFPMDDQMLHNAMILYGEIESIRSFPSRNYSFVEFRSVEEALRAKEGLQGILFNDPRILIMYSNSGLSPPKDQSDFHPGIKGIRPDMFLNDITFWPGQMDVYNHNHSIVPNSFPGHIPPRAVPGPDMLRRPLGPQGSLKPLLPGPESSDLAKLPNPNILIGGPIRKRLSPAPGVLSSPTPGTKPSIRPDSGSWDVFDPSQLQREFKRSRTDDPLTNIDPSFSLRKRDDSDFGLDQLYRRDPQVHGGVSGAPANVRSMNRFSPVDSKVVTQGISQGHPKLDIWSGTIKKGGTHVCDARCVPLGEEFEFDIPDEVNCSARTGLDLLTEHYNDAIGFSVVFFLPNSEKDFAPYTEFLRYLGAKNRAGVAKFDNGTTLFLVPPSDFLSKVLNISGPERLYGVVLKFPHHVPSITSKHSRLGQPQYIDRPLMAPRTLDSIPQEEGVLQTDYNHFPHENLNHPPKSIYYSTSDSLPKHAAQSISTAAMSQAGVTLTPELIATLASFLPAKGNSSVAQPASGSSVRSPVSTPAVPDSVHPQGWKVESNIPVQSGHPLNQVGNQFNGQGQFPSQLPGFASSDLAQGVTSKTQIEDSNFNMPQQGDAPYRRTLANFAPLQSGQFAVSPQVNQQYPQAPQDYRHAYGQGTDSIGLYSVSVLQPVANPVALSDQVHSTTVPQRQIGVPLAAENFGLEPLNQVQQLQSVLSGSGQGTSEVEVDKNERYQSTLQFAANLLLQLQQQQQQQPVTQGAQGSAYHQ